MQTQINIPVFGDERLPTTFWQRVRVLQNGCWSWRGRRTILGYGVFYLPVRHNVYAHRIAYRMLVGPIPVGLEIDHLCRLTSCVNPSHLEAVTHGENLRRAGVYGLWQRRRTHCPQGHPYSAGNLYSQPDGRRTCRICNKAKAERYRERTRNRGRRGGILRISVDRTLKGE